jgi:ParB family chromosome partitioning protein
VSDKRRGLGRGLSALLPADEGIRSLPIDQLQPSRHQPRSWFDDAGLDELAASIRAQGVIQPLIVTPTGSGGYTIVAGERRWRAARRAGLKVVPVVVRQVRDDRQQLELALVENLQRADLNPIEEAEAFRSLQEGFGLSHEEIAERVGRARPAVTNTLRLLKLPSAVQDLLRAGRLTAGQARPLLALDDPEEILRMAERAATEGLSARALEALAGAAAPADAPKRKRRGAGRPVEPHAAAAAERLTQSLQTRVEIERRRRGGQIRIHFHSEEELMRLYDLLVEKGERR